MKPAAGTALVVGNTDGIGLALTRRLLKDGWTVLGVSRRAAAFEHPAYTHLIADVAAPAYWLALRGALSVTPVVCIYCAGIGELFDVERLAEDPRIFQVNLVGAVTTAALVLPLMLAAGQGHFIALSSIGDQLSAEAPSYAASKAGLTSYLAGLRLALRGRGVAVTNVRLGFVDTKMAKGPVKPLMITVERAVELIVRSFSGRPPTVTSPKLMGALAWLLTRLNWLRLWFS